MTNEEYLLVAKASEALAHPARVAIFSFIYGKNLSRENVCNKDIVAEFEYSQSTVSQHIAKLLLGGLVELRQKGTSSFYYVNLGMLGRYIDAVKKLRR